MELLNAGYEVVVVDNLSNSKEEAVRRVQEITGKSLKFIRLTSWMLRLALYLSKSL